MFCKFRLFKLIDMGLATTPELMRIPRSQYLKMAESVVFTDSEM